MNKRMSESEIELPISTDKGVINDSFMANAAISSSISPIAFVDYDKEIIIYVNYAFLSIWGYQSSEEVIGKNISKFWQSKQKSEQIHRKIHNSGGWIGELVAYRKDGKEFPVQVQATMLIDKNSNPLHQMISFIDISERVAAQMEQRRLLADLQERVKELNCLYSILSIQYKNESLIEGILERVVAIIPSSLRWPEYSYARIVIGDIDVSTPNFKTTDNKLSIPLSIGSDTGFLEVGYFPGCPTGEKMVFLGEEKILLEAAAKEIERLIEQKRSENELHRNRERLLHADKLSSIGILSAEIMHEIGNPNNFIALNTGILTRVWDDVLPILDMYYKENGDFSVGGLPFTEARQEVPRLLEGIVEGSKRIKAISSQLKTFLAKKRQIQHSPFYINEAVNKAVNFCRNLIDSSTDNFHLVLTTANPVVKGDSSQIQQIIINLITNACQALTSCNDQICISSILDKQNDCVKVIVEDKGRGIHQHDLPLVMNPFFTTKTDRESTGLGLSISNDIAISHGGKLLLHSVLHQGTRVVLVLPAYERNKLTKDEK